MSKDVTLCAAYDQISDRTCRYYADHGGRHNFDGDGWVVFSEFANGTGYRVKGWADAALGIWPNGGRR